MARHAKPTGRSEVIARLRRVEGWNSKRFTMPVSYDSEEAQAECICKEPEDNDEGVCMNCGLCIPYGSME